MELGFLISLLLLCSFASSFPAPSKEDDSSSKTFINVKNSVIASRSPRSPSGHAPGHPSSSGRASQRPKPSDKLKPSSSSSSSSSRTESIVGSGATAIRFSATGAWATQDCTTHLTDQNISPKKRWKESGGNDAWEASLAAWNDHLASIDDDVKRKNESFSKWLLNAFEYRDGVDCADITDDGCNHMLDQGDCTTPFAGYLLTEALIGIHEPLQGIYNAFDQAWKAPSTQIDELEKTFMPRSQMNFALLKNLLADLGLFLAPLMPAFVVGGVAVGPLIAGATTYSTVAGKDLIQGDEKPDGEIQNAIFAYTIKFSGMILGFTKLLMSAHNETTQNALTSIIKDGKSLGSVSVSNSRDPQKDVDTAISMMWSKLVPWAWGWQYGDAYRPTILFVNKDAYQCGDPLPKGGQSDLGMWMSQDTADKTCYKDKNGDSWFFFRPVTPRDCTGPTTCYVTHSQEIFWPLAGWDEFNGNKKWGGITLEDIVLSAYGGFLANDHKNGFQTSEKSSKVLQDDMKTLKDYEWPMAGTVRTAGYWNVTICFDTEEVKDNTFANKPPCGEKPKSTMPDGWCGLHVSEYRRSYKSNTLDSNQFEVTVKDNIGRKIGYMDWKNAEPTVKIDSDLPHPIYIAEGDSDDDHISFWYNDQHWLSNSKTHECSFGGYENGYSNGDCRFKCPPKEDSPKKDPPVPVPTALPHGTYKAGWCGIHVYTVKKTRFGSLKSTYTVSLVLKDNDQNILKSHKDIKDMPARIKGSLPHTLVVTPGYYDTKFTYNGDTWKASDSRCHFDGKWDDGRTQQIDCGFTC